MTNREATGWLFLDSQADMRRGYFSGAPGVAVSACVWLIAALVAKFHSPALAVIVLLVGGAAIHPASIVVNKGLGRTGSHGAGNPLGGLAIEGTIWFLAGIAVAYGMQALRLEWFFPAMLLLVGGRYLTFQTVYGMRIYWLLGAAMCMGGLVLGLMRADVALSALFGALAESIFAAIVFAQARHDGAVQAG